MTMRVSKDRIDMDDKVLQRPVLKDYAKTVVTANSGTSYTVDHTNGNVFNITLTGNCSFTFANPPSAGAEGSFTLILTQDGTGNRTVTWPAAVEWLGDGEPTLVTEGTDIIEFSTVDGGTTWYGLHKGANDLTLNLAYIGLTSDTASQTTYTFSGVSIGDAADDRLVIVGACSSETGANRSVSSISIGGSAATLHAATAEVDWHPVGIASRVVTSGTTADISVTFSGSVPRAAIFVWTMRNYSSATPHDTATAQGTTASSRSVTLDVPANGAALFVCAKGTTTSITWSSATENEQTTVESRSLAGAYKLTTSAISGHTETATFGTSTGGSGLVGVSWS